ncbi:MAG TPA: RsmB/NOP family class I SAM-dependent RNA methyltransferase [Stellaceae bacterium]|nr:RsmB/NOP family class I SAM-dependent RNA methyltransferase [Stellaceae bacterium]
MTPGARIAAAIDILEALAAGTRPADDVAADYFRRRRYIGSKDRAQVSRHVYSVLRHRATLDWWVDRAGKGDIRIAPRSRIMAALAIAEGEPETEIVASFDGGKFRPAALAPAEEQLVHGLAGRSLRHPAMPRAVANDVPDWLLRYLEAVYGGQLEEEMAGLNAAAPVDLRVNLIKTDRAGAIGSLAAEGIRAEPTPWSPTGLRLAERVPLSGLAAFKDGLIEVQDEGSQLAALLLGAKPGMRVVDFCAGAGGKTLALAAAMKNRGKIVACDTAGWRLDRSGQRLRRAGASNVERHALASERDPWVKRHAKSFDRVLVDAPCLGVGSWRRNPDAKWRATPRDLAELEVRQHDILASAARLVKPGGRLAYVTCSLLHEENEAQAERFLAETADFTLVPVAQAWAEAIGTPCPADGDFLRLTPAQHGTDGFFVAVFEREKLQPQPASFEAPDGAPQDEEDF